jgi:hypothetical protein
MLETLFFKTYHSYLEGNLRDTEMYLAFMKKECKLHPGENTLNEHYIPELKKIITAVKTKSIPRQEWLSDPVPSDSTGAKTSLKQAALVKLIHEQGFNSLAAILQVDKGFKLHNIEHPCPPFGAVDMFYQDSITCYPLEVKKDRGEHDIIGQIMKYELFCKRRLHIKAYYKVQPVTVCACYDTFTLGQLKQLGVVTIKYTETDGSITLKKI